MEYLPGSNRVQQGDIEVSPIDAEGKHVVIIGGGDTGADCLGTAHRQGAASVTQLEIMPRPPDARAESNPWPQWSLVYRVTSAHEEGGERVYSVNTERFVDDGDGNVKALLLHEVEMVDGRFQKIEGTDRELPADLVFLALGIRRTGEGRVARSARRRRSTSAATSPATTQFMSSVPGVFVAGDMGRGQSLIVWAIAEGRACAAGADRWLMGETSLPSPILPTATAPGLSVG